MFYTPGTVTHGASHVRDAIDLKRMMILVWMAVFPAMFWGMYNVGQQAIPALHHLYSGDQLQQVLTGDWHYQLAQWLGASLTPDAGWVSKMVLGGDLLCANLRRGVYRRRLLGSAVCHYPQA
ncbi:Na(+)-translocating NADH-quinone reductase subunit B [Serratia odorifera]|uniref:Na(+)-translocating NADH-quinone reductase subunit B n=1 Tax=Serratia odorifera TaxID=618 RepID=A0A3S5D6S7_SEROD|nr:Na(+)-translocating NADH-quinone reductase subunit B [Serratia odorifera]